MSRTKLASLVTLAALAAGVLLWRARGGAPPAAEEAAPPGARAPHTSPPRLVTAPETYEEPAATTPFLRESAPAEPPPPAPPAPPRGPRQSMRQVLEDYRAEVCACDSLACADRVGARYTKLVADSQHQRADDASVAQIREAMVACVIALNAKASRPGGGT